MWTRVRLAAPSPEREAGRAEKERMGSVQTRMNLLEKETVRQRERQDVTEHLRAEALERLVSLLEADSPFIGSDFHLLVNRDDTMSRVARLRVARATYALSRLENHGRIERVGPGAFILNRRIA
jgi:hypothetical protein